MLRCWIIFTSLFFPSLVLASEFVLSFRYDAGQLEKYYIHIQGNQAIFFKYHIYDFVYDENEKKPNLSDMFFTTLSEKQLDQYKRDLVKIGVPTWKGRYSIHEKKPGKKVYCHSSWQLFLAHDGEGMIRDGYCDGPESLKEFIKASEETIKKATNKTRNELDGSVEPPIR